MMPTPLQTAVAVAVAVAAMCGSVNGAPVAPVPGARSTPPLRNGTDDHTHMASVDANWTRHQPPSNASVSPGASLGSWQANQCANEPVRSVCTGNVPCDDPFGEGEGTAYWTFPSSAVTITAKVLGGDVADFWLGPVQSPSGDTVRTFKVCGDGGDGWCSWNDVGEMSFNGHTTALPAGPMMMVVGNMNLISHKSVTFTTSVYSAAKGLYVSCSQAYPLNKGKSVDAFCPE